MLTYWHYVFDNDNHEFHEIEFCSFWSDDKSWNHISYSKVKQFQFNASNWNEIFESYAWDFHMQELCASLRMYDSECNVNSWCQVSSDKELQIVHVA